MKPPTYRGKDRRPTSGPPGARPTTPRPASSRPSSAGASSAASGERAEPREDRGPRPTPAQAGKPQRTKSGHPGQYTPKRNPAPAGRTEKRSEPRAPRERPVEPSANTLRAPLRDIPRAPDLDREGTRGTLKPAPNGAVWLYGTHAVAAALTNTNRLLRRVMLTEEAEADIARRVSGPMPMTIERVDRARLEQLLGRGVSHQGAALLADPLPQISLQSALLRPGPIVVLDQVTDPRNVGAIIRSAAAFGAAAVITQDRNAPDENGAMAKAACGAMERLPLIRAVNIARTIIALRAAGLWIVGLDADGTKLVGRAFAERRVALVLGNEGEGLRRLTRETCDEICAIAMPGGSTALDSLNVSAAATVALYELVGHA